MSQDQQTYHRAVNGSLLGLAVQTLGILALWLLAYWTQHPSAVSAAWCAAGGLLPWLCLLVIFQQHRLERLEALETESLKRQAGADQSIFEQSQEELAVARRRLTHLYKWALPITGTLQGLYALGISIWLLYRHAVPTEPWVWDQLTKPLFSAGLAFATAFVCFIVSRYLAGMSREPSWILLRGGASQLLMNVLVAVALTAGFILSYAELPWLLRELVVIFPIFQLLLGIETILGLILNFYLPRKQGEFPRPAFDSRLLGFLNSPEGFGRAVQETLHYQFGFEVTKSWFWQLLSQAALPLLGLGVAALLLLSCVVIVEPYQQALVLRFGQLRPEPPLEPGLSLKLPWPLETVELYDVKRIREFRTGFVGEYKEGEPILWTNKHLTVEDETLWLTKPVDASALREGNAGETGVRNRAPAVPLLTVDVPVRYRIQDLVAFVKSTAATEPAEQALACERRLKLIAEARLARHLANRDIDVLMKADGRLEVGLVLQKDLQAAVDQAGMGLEIVSVTMAGVHPPNEAAEPFFEMIRAMQEKETSVEQAKQESIKIRAEAAGSDELARQLVMEIEKLEGEKDEAKAAEQSKRLDELLLKAGGQAAKTLADALAYRWSRAKNEESSVARFEKDDKADKQASRVYRMHRYLDVLAEGLADRKKIMLLGERKHLTVRMDLKESDVQTLDLTKPK